MFIQRLWPVAQINIMFEQRLSSGVENFALLLMREYMSVSIRGENQNLYSCIQHLIIRWIVDEFIFLNGESVKRKTMTPHQVPVGIEGSGSSISQNFFPAMRLLNEV